MNSKDITKAVVTGLAYSGVVIDKMDDTEEKFIMYISVPKMSTLKNKDGQEMSGDFLAKRVKSSFKEMQDYYGISQPMEVRYKIRDEEWNEELAKKYFDYMSRLTGMF